MNCQHSFKTISCSITGHYSILQCERCEKFQLMEERTIMKIEQCNDCGKQLDVSGDNADVFDTLEDENCNTIYLCIPCLKENWS
jgi:uncharacterized radical SAM superfamily protein